MDFQAGVTAKSHASLALVMTTEDVDTLVGPNSSPEIVNPSPSFKNYACPKCRPLFKSECSSGVLSLTYEGICQRQG